MTSAAWAEILTSVGAVLAGGATLIGALVAAAKARARRLDKLALRDWQRALVGNVTISRAMGNLLVETTATRVLLIRVTNGGGIVKPGSPLRLDVIEERFAPPQTSCIEDFQGTRVDERYREAVLMPLVLHGKVLLVTSQLPPDHFLRDTYEAQGVVCSYLKAVSITSKEAWFLSLNVHTTNAERFGAEWSPDPVMREASRRAARQIAATMPAASALEVIDSTEIA